jgi:hypothetical protein
MNTLINFFFPSKTAVLQILSQISEDQFFQRLLFEKLTKMAFSIPTSNSFKRQV